MIRGQELQERTAKACGSVGRVDHDWYRSFSSERKCERSSGFIDGDLLECVLDLPSEKLAHIARGLKVCFRSHNSVCTHILYTRDFQTVGPGPKFGPLTDFFWAL